MCVVDSTVIDRKAAMPRRAYKTGTRDQVLRRMASYAIRDQQALIDAYRPCSGEPDETARQVIAQAQDAIADFRRLAKSAGVPT